MKGLIYPENTKSSIFLVVSSDYVELLCINFLDLQPFPPPPIPLELSKISEIYADDWSIKRSVPGNPQLTLFFLQAFGFRKTLGRALQYLDHLSLS